MVAQYIGRNQKTWDEYIAALQYAYNTAWHKATGHIPPAPSNARGDTTTSAGEIGPQVREWVWKKNHALSDNAKAFNAKLAPKFVGPLEVRKIVSPVIVDLRDAQGRWHRHIYVQELKPHTGTNSRPAAPNAAATRNHSPTFKRRQLPKIGDIPGDAPAIAIGTTPINRIEAANNRADEPTTGKLLTIPVRADATARNGGPTTADAIANNEKPVRTTAPTGSPIHVDATAGNSRPVTDTDTGRTGMRRRQSTGPANLRNENAISNHHRSISPRVLLAVPHRAIYQFRRYRAWTPEGLSWLPKDSFQFVVNSSQITTKHSIVVYCKTLRSPRMGCPGGSPRQAFVTTALAFEGRLE
ncbi:hypothetical protein RF55_11996 [Lasius niger]|uniref:Uncharacterized protein n=1 Tax=Lasius niger TaxID=67767 RepID=A0A0J7N736_LASNI|nr:hypothetical protein RF55_11996 [Lasius niger]